MGAVKGKGGPEPFSSRPSPLRVGFELIRSRKQISPAGPWLSVTNRLGPHP